MNNIPACLLDGNLLSLAAYLPMLVYSLTSISCFNADGSIRRLIFRSVSVVILLTALLTILSCIAPGHTHIQAGLISLLLLVPWLRLEFRKVPVPALAFVMLTGILTCAYSHVLWSLCSLLINPYHRKADMKSVLLPLLLQLLVEMAVYVLTITDFSTQIRWLIRNEPTHKIWNLAWTFPAALSLVCFFMQPSHRYIMKAGKTLPIYLTCCIILLVLIIMMYYTTLHLVREMSENRTLLLQAHELELMEEQYRIMNSQIEQTRRLRHDYRHFLTTLTGLLNGGEQEQALTLLAEYMPNLDASFRHYCDSPPVNALLSHYAALCHESGIAFGVGIRFSGQTGVSMTDFCVLLGNLLENAYDACLEYKSLCRLESKKDQPPPVPRIELRVSQNSDRIIAVSISNTISLLQEKAVRELLIPSFQTSKRFLSTKHPGEGQGLRSADHISRQHHGSMDIDITDGKFTVKTILNS